MPGIVLDIDKRYLFNRTSGPQYRIFSETQQFGNILKGYTLVVKPTDA